MGTARRMTSRRALMLVVLAALGCGVLIVGVWGIRHGLEDHEPSRHTAAVDAARQPNGPGSVRRFVKAGVSEIVTWGGDETNDARAGRLAAFVSDPAKCPPPLTTPQGVDPRGAYTTVSRINDAAHEGKDWWRVNLDYEFHSPNIDQGAAYDMSVEVRVKGNRIVECIYDLGGNSHEAR